MIHLKTLTATASVAALMAAGSASADVTAQDVWASWQDLMGFYGEDSFTIGGESQVGGVLTVSDIKMRVDDSSGTMSMDLGDLVFAEQGNGTVLVSVAENYPISLTFSDGGAMDMNVAQTGMRILASGTPELLNYDVTADRYTVSIDSLVEDNGEAVDGEMRFTGNNMSGTYTVSDGDPREVNYALAMGSLDMLIDITDPDTKDKVVMSGKINGMNGAAQLMLPQGAAMDKPEDMFAAGLAIVGGYGFDSANYVFEFNADGAQATGSASTGAGDINLGFSNAAMSYDVNVAEVAANILSADFPFPINISLSEYGFGIDVPLARAEELSDFGIGLNLSDLAVNDEIWMLADPTGALSHEPATINIDLTGKARMFLDILDPEQAEAMENGAVPGELHALTLNDLTLAIAGAMVQGNGGFTFDNSDMSTIPGFPRPEGQITVNINGANQLIDALVGMGLLPEDQAMMGRMMMGMFARTVGEDQLESVIEINDKGHILANGQRIQ